MSTCGSIVSNDFPIFEGDIMFNNGIKNQIQSFYGSHLGQETNCLENCFTFVFEKNQIKSLSHLKNEEQNFFSSKVNWQMQKFGLGIHLVNF